MDSYAMMDIEDLKLDHSRLKQELAVIKGHLKELEDSHIARINELEIRLTAKLADIEAICQNDMIELEKYVVKLQEHFARIPGGSIVLA